MPLEQRSDARYWSSRQALFVRDDVVSNLCVITNLSNGGLCLAVVGSARPLKQDRIILKVNQGTIHCNIVHQGKEGLHCRFEHPIGEQDLWDDLPLSHMTGRKTAATMNMGATIGTPLIEGNTDQSKLLSHSVKNKQTPPVRHTINHIYTEGYFAGMAQIDPAVDLLDAAMDILNPYRTPREKARWVLGFMDAVYRATSR